MIWFGGLEDRGQLSIYPPRTRALNPAKKVCQNTTFACESHSEKWMKDKRPPGKKANTAFERRVPRCQA